MRKTFFLPSKSFAIPVSPPHLHSITLIIWPPKLSLLFILSIKSFIFNASSSAIFLESPPLMMPPIPVSAPNEQAILLLKRVKNTSIATETAVHIGACGPLQYTKNLERTEWVIGVKASTDNGEKISKNIISATTKLKNPFMQIYYHLYT